MNNYSLKTLGQSGLAILAIITGVITIFVGSRTLLGISDPGYTIFYPLLLFNTAMGLFYAAAGIFIWIDHNKQVQACLLIFSANLIMLILMILLYLFDTEIAAESFKAMTFRTGFWIAIYPYLKK